MICIVYIYTHNPKVKESKYIISHPLSAFRQRTPSAHATLAKFAY